MSTCGFTHMLDPRCTIEVGPDTTLVGTDGFFGGVLMEDVLEALAKQVGRWRRGTYLLELC